MAQVIKTTFQLRRGLLEIWEKNNPILAKGEPSFVVDKNALKIGDGVTPWKELEYIGLSQEDLAEAIEDYFKENPSGGTGGTINPEDIAAAVKDYLSKNPPEVPDLSDEVTRAETAAQRAENANSSAQAALSGAAGAASDANTYAQQAQGFSGSASGSAGFANTRANAADAAATKAEKAASDAEAAADRAEEAAKVTTDLDTTLTQEGKAADAKAVGDAISKLSGGGTDGRGIVSIIRTDGDGSAGTIDTYTITYTDLTTSTFTVYNGKDGASGNGITLIEYEITTTPGDPVPLRFVLDNGDTYDVTIPGGSPGRGITSILRTSGNGAPGSTDTYTINYNDNSTSTFTVYNGKDGKDGSATEGVQREPQVFQTTSFDLLPTTDVYIGDFGIVKTQIVDGKDSHTAFIYTENGWAALDGNYNANNVYFDEDLLVTTKIGTIQTLTNGQATLSAKGKTLKQVFSSLIAERKAPTATLPSGTIEWTNYENGNYLVEVGETITPTWKTTFSAGSYTYGPATGVAPVQAKVYLSTNSSSSSTIDAGEMNGKTGNLSALIVNDASTKHYAKVEYGWTNGTSTPKDNFGDDHINTSKNLPIQAASGKTDTSTYYIQGYRKAFFGSRVSPIELTSHNIRSLASNANSSNASFTVTIDQGATQVVIAVPQGRVVKKVEDNGAFGQDILEAFDKYTNSSTINVGGADATSSNIGNYSAKYNVYVYNPSTPLGSNTYTVILDNE